MSGSDADGQYTLLHEHGQSSPPSRRGLNGHNPASKEIEGSCIKVSAQRVGVIFRELGYQQKIGRSGNRFRASARWVPTASPKVLSRGSSLFRDAPRHSRTTFGNACRCYRRNAAGRLPRTEHPLLCSLRCALSDQGHEPLAVIEPDPAVLCKRLGFRGEHPLAAYPPAAPRAATMPLSSRTTRAPTLRVRQAS
jgi:hypothetical protein